MREIKFRAWETKEERMIQSGSFDIHIYSKGYGISYQFLGEDIRQYRFDSCKRNNFDSSKPEVILLQYTGLKDKNGVEIYEEDIILTTLFKVDKGCMYEVVFTELAARFDGMSLLSGIGEHLSILSVNCEVIGNKFENPELIK